MKISERRGIKGKDLFYREMENRQYFIWFMTFPMVKPATLMNPTFEQKTSNMRTFSHFLFNYAKYFKY